ncbi:MAG: MotA/TolQ/ExbB proton channel family protein [Myxococcota bacterium]|nr:MotA/TolQ/ExbB proton channel family protein [Myxococcota bacterium]
MTLLQGENFSTYYISFMLIVVLVYLFQRKDVSTASSLASQLGILGTFLGIIGALQDMDVSTVSAGVPSLLAGMQTAFYSSAAGILLSMSLKIFKSSISSYLGEEGVTEITSTDFLQEMRQTNLILSEIQLGNAQSFALISEKLDTSNTEELERKIEILVDELQQNFGDNFSKNLEQFNNAVEKVITWQQSSSNQMERADKTFKILFKLMENLPNKVAELEKQFQKISLGTEKSSKNLRIVVQQYQELAKSLQDQKGTMDALIQNFDKAQKSYNSAVENQIQRFNKVLDDELSKSLKNVGGQLSTLSEKFVDDYGILTDKLQEVVRMTKKVDGSRR